MNPVSVLILPAVLAAAIWALVRPWLPGAHDPSALPVSWAMQGLAWGACLLVPLGLARLLVGTGRAGRVLGRAVLIGAAVVGAAIAALTLVSGGLTLAVLVLGVVGLLWSGLRRLPPRMQGAALAIVPAVLAAVQFAALPRLEPWARGRAMDNADEMIAELETHRTANGRYPPSLLALWPDYETGIVGAPAYRYEADGDSYRIVFEVPRSLSPTRTLAAYSPAGRWSAHSHAAHRVTLPPGQEADGRGHFASAPGDRPHWRLFHFD